VKVGIFLVLIVFAVYLKCDYGLVLENKWSRPIFQSFSTKKEDEWNDA